MSGLKHCPFCGFEETSMGYDRTVTCGNCGAKGPWDKDAYDGAGDEQEMWNHRRVPPMPDGTITADQLCECRYDLARVVELLGEGSCHLRKAMEKFDDPELPEPLNIIGAQQHSVVASRAFREVERLAKELADTCGEWSEYKREGKP